MARYIEFDALVAEIERLKNTSLEYGYNTMQKVLADSGKDLSLGQLQYFLDTLGVKEMDLDESARHYLLHEHVSPLNEVLHQADLKVEMQYHKDIEGAYKAGFELGLKARQ